MLQWLLAVVVVGLLALAAAWTSRRLLDDQVSWARAVMASLVVFFIGVPLSLWFLRAVGIWNGTTFQVDGYVAVASVALTVGWLFAVVVIVILSLEFLWPSRRMPNPITLIREAFRRRDRARRYTQILNIASRHGIGFFWGRRKAEHDELPAALVAAMNEAGVTFVKIGQLLSSRDDILPHDITEALSALQSDSRPVPWAQARGAIERQLGKPLDEVFATVDEHPLAAASVAQVHAATLLDGRKVVIKIQRPAARAQVRTDLNILERLAVTFERRSEWARDYRISALAGEFGRSLAEELDYRIELANVEMLRGAQTARVRVPRMYPEYSTEQLIVQERAPGIPLSRLGANWLATSSLTAADAHRIANDVLDAVLDHIAVRGVFHADLHAGNLLLAEDGTITLIDFGAVGIVEKSIRRLLVPLLIAVANEDDIVTTDVLLLLVTPPAGGVDVPALQHDVGVILTRVRHSPAEDNVLSLLVGVLRQHRMGIPPSLILVFRTIASLEGSLRRIQSDYDMIARALERAPHLATAMISPRSAALTAQSELALAVERLRRIPRRIDSITSSLEDGTFTVNVGAIGGTDERSWLDGIIGQLITTIVGATLVIAGIMMVTTSGGPVLAGNLSVLAFIGSVVGLGGLLLILRALRKSLRSRDG